MPGCYPAYDRPPTSTSSSADFDPQSGLWQGLQTHYILAPMEYKDAMASPRATQSAIGFLVVGLGAVVGGYLRLDTASGMLLIAVGATFLFGSIAAYTLDADQYLPATVHESVYSDTVANQLALIDEHRLLNTLVYIPRTRSDRHPVLFVPKYPDHTLPRETELDSLYTGSDSDRSAGIALRPLGATLARRYESMLSGELSDRPDELAVQLSDGLIEGFELADSVETDVQTDDEIVQFDVSGSVYDRSGGIEDPIQSFFAVGLAMGLGMPIAVESGAMGSEEDGYRLRCRWIENYRQELV